MKKTGLICLSTIAVGIGIFIKSINNREKKYRSLKKEYELLDVDQKEAISNIAITPKPRKYDKRLLKDLIAITSLDDDTLIFLSKEASPWAKKIIF